MATFEDLCAFAESQMAQNGLVRCIRPANTMHDGDTIFALSTSKKKANINIVGAFAAQSVQTAILNAIKSAESLGGVPSLTDLVGGEGGSN